MQVLLKGSDQRRNARFDTVESGTPFDVAILGGGINGACLYDHLCRRGYRVLLLERSDFASGTSQHSGMMVWGGLLYLKNLDFTTVFKLCRGRDYLIRDLPEWVRPQFFRYLPSHQGGRSLPLMWLGLSLYWLMGLGRRQRPAWAPRHNEQDLIQPGVTRGSILYEEAFLEGSDSQFVFSWIHRHEEPHHVALNYCRTSGAFSPVDKHWHLELEDTVTGRDATCRARTVINCAGVWTDEVNASFGIQTPFRHAFSKGVYLNLKKRPEHDSLLVFELGEHDDTVTLVPWGPIAMWGPTETAIDTLDEGFCALPEDVHYLMEHYDRRFRTGCGKGDIVSVRCGVRPLVVEKSYHAKVYPLELSRRQQIVSDDTRPWISCYGGKITDCRVMASKVASILARTCKPTGEASSPGRAPIPHTQFPGLEQPVADPLWAGAEGACCTLQDYLRRRTNIAQWVERGGLGVGDVYLPTLRITAERLLGDPARAAAAVDQHRKSVQTGFDALIDNI